MSDNKKPRTLEDLLAISASDISEFIKLEIGYYNSQSDIAKFTISISTTALFAIIGFPDLANKVQLTIISIVILIGSIIWLAIVLNKHKKLTKRVEKHFLERQKAIISLYK